MTIKDKYDRHMFSDKVYKFSDLRRIIQESASESKPKIDPKVIRDDAQNNAKAVKDIMKETGAFEGKATGDRKRQNPENIYDTNKTTLDVDFAYAPSKEYKDRVKSQVHGFASAEHEKNAETDESVDVSGNKEFYNEREALSKDRNEKETEDRHAGLKSHNKDKEDFKDNSIYTNESKAMKKLTFKNTVFLSEAQVMKKVPDDYKVDGNKFIMADKNNNQYLVECKVDDRFKDYTHLTVTKRETKEQLAEELGRMKELFGYKSTDFNKDSTVESRRREDKSLSKMLRRVKKMEKSGKPITEGINDGPCTLANLSSQPKYASYAVIADCDMALLGNYDNLEDAVEDAIELAKRYRQSSFRVCGFDENREGDYDDTCVFSTYDEEYLSER